MQPAARETWVDLRLSRFRCPRTDVPVRPEHVLRVVRRLGRDETVEVIAVRCLETLLVVVGRLEVDVIAAGLVSPLPKLSLVFFAFRDVTTDERHLIAVYQRYLHLTVCL